jgi:hypothetical protein
VPRPAWRRTILDRFIANTYRSLAGATPAPFAWTGQDTVLFALADPEATPDGLRMGLELGAWKPKGRAAPRAAAEAALHAGGYPALLRAIG